MTDRDETTDETTAIEKRPQPHGGALNGRGTPGNRGGGRTPSAIRATAREKFDKLIPRLDRIARAKTTKDSDRVRAIDVLGKYGMDRAVSVDDVKTCLRQTTEEIREFLPPEQAEVLLGRIRPIWLNL